MKKECETCKHNKAPYPYCESCYIGEQRSIWPVVIIYTLGIAGLILLLSTTGCVMRTDEWIF